MIKNTVAIAAACLLGFAAPAFAGQQDFTLNNETGKGITHVYVSEATSQEWGDDVLGAEVALEDGEASEISFDGYEDDVCKFDVKITLEDGKSWTVSNIDLCTMHDLVFKMQGGKVVYAKH